MKRLAVSQRVDFLSDRNETRDSLDEKLLQFLIFGGYLPFPVPNVLSAADVIRWCTTLELDGIVLSGGNDIGAFQSRDDTERALLNFAESHSLPVLGICRGMQMMTVFSGGTLQRVAGHVRTRHFVSGEINQEVNSFHDYSVSGVPNGYRVAAISSDGEIEAIRHERLRWEGWMWHPEREPTFQNIDIRNLRSIFG